MQKIILLALMFILAGFSESRAYEPFDCASWQVENEARPVLFVGYDYIYETQILLVENYVNPKNGYVCERFFFTFLGKTRVLWQRWQVEDTKYLTFLRLDDGTHYEAREDSRYDLIFVGLVNDGEQDFLIIRVFLFEYEETEKGFGYEIKRDRVLYLKYTKKPR